MNVLVGVNGTGKSSMLEAIRVAIGALFLGVDKYEGKIAAPGIIADDVRLENLEPLYPVAIEAKGSINTFDANHEESPKYEDITWIRSMEKHGGSTTRIKAKKMSEVSEQMQRAIRENRGTIPLVAYYSTDRYKKERKDYGVEADGSRLRGYFNSLDSTTNIKFFQNLFFTETLDATQKQRPSEMLAAVVSAIKECVKCKEVYYDFKKAEIIMVGEDDVHMPMHLLSDGVRSVLSLVMELAFRSYLLNPHKGADAPKERVVRLAAEDARIKYECNPQNSGAAITRNNALRRAQGKWIAFLDSDDLWHPEKLEKQVKFMVENGYHFSYTEYVEMDETGKETGVLISGPKHVTRRGMYNFC